MALRAIPIRRAGNRENLFMGGDRELVMFSGLLAGALIFSAQEVRATVFGIALWFGALFALRLMAKADPKLRHVYLRHRRYKPYYPARSTPFRDNTPSQGKQYKSSKQSQLPLLCSVRFCCSSSLPASGPSMPS